jgi:hypothetical protein
LGGDSFQVRLDADKPSVGEAKVEIARGQGTEVECQELYRVAAREDGRAVREDDAEPELLDDEGYELEEGAVVAMAVKDSPPLLWRTFPEECVELSEGGTVVTQIKEAGETYATRMIMVTTGAELTEGRHCWEVEPLSEDYIFVGVTRPNLDPKEDYAVADCTDAWFIDAEDGGFWGNGEHGGNDAGNYVLGNNGSLLFFKNAKLGGLSRGMRSVGTPPPTPAAGAPPAGPWQEPNWVYSYVDHVWSRSHMVNDNIAG